MKRIRPIEYNFIGYDNNIKFEILKTKINCLITAHNSQLEGEGVEELVKVYEKYKHLDDFLSHYHLDQFQNMAHEFWVAIKQALENYKRGGV